VLNVERGVRTNFGRWTAFTLSQLQGDLHDPRLLPRGDGLSPRLLIWTACTLSQLQGDLHDPRLLPTEDGVSPRLLLLIKLNIIFVTQIISRFYR